LFTLVALFKTSGSLPKFLEAEWIKGLVMKNWSSSAIDRYYLDPTIQFLAATKREGSKPGGYFVVPHCDPDCCAAFGGVSTANLGPFETRIKARDWSRKYMVEPRDRLQ
jgi:hypothetical protein